MMSGGTMDVNQFSLPGSMGMPPQNIGSYGQPNPLLNDPPAAIQERTKKRLDKYRENAKRKGAGHDTQVNHLLTKDLKETEKYHAKVNELKTKRKTGRDRKDNEKNSNGLRPDEQNAIMKGIHEKIRESKKASRMKANFGQSKRHVATAPVVAHPMFSEASQTPFGLVGNEIQLKLDPDRLTGFSDLKQDELVAFLDSQASNNQLNHAAGHIVPSALGENFLQQQVATATGDQGCKSPRRIPPQAVAERSGAVPPCSASGRKIFLPPCSAPPHRFFFTAMADFRHSGFFPPQRFFRHGGFPPQRFFFRHSGFSAMADFRRSGFFSATAIFPPRRISAAAVFFSATAIIPPRRISAAAVFFFRHSDFSAMARGFLASNLHIFHLISVIL
ncbi:unnamed protein product [Oikopleura dioica]|uniref:Uncharacterized protein n=1 Tax=Oikopleura dioica TaxID=34765 RepID=E4XB60_OIKDI|nr:unnamed protein product [Oikopleura dioica]